MDPNMRELPDTLVRDATAKAVEADRVGLVMVAADALSLQLQRLDSVTGRLEDRLGPVLDPNLLMPARGQVGNDDRQTQSALTENIAGMGHNLCDQVDRLEHLLQRVELQLASTLGGLVAHWEVIDAEPGETVVAGDEERTMLTVHTAVTMPNGALQLVRSHHVLTERQLARFYATYLPEVDPRELG